MNRRHFLYGVATGASALALWQFRPDAAEAAYPYRLTDAQWRSRLSPWAYKVLRQGATEFPDSSPLNREHRAGTFTCAGCAQNLFSSKTKFDSGTGWPSFWDFIPGTLGTTSVDPAFAGRRVATSPEQLERPGALLLSQSLGGRCAAMVVGT